MLTYVRIGTVHYTQEDTSVGQFFKHGASWEFMVCLSGSMAPDLGTTSTQNDMQSATLWVFPGHHSHGWRSMAPCERAVFHFSQVPSELEQYLPDGGYYGMKLSPLDCERIRALAEETIAAHKASSAFIGLQDSVLAGKLALIALRAIKPKQISSNEIALQKTQQALDWYSIHMSEGPDQVAVARAVNVSPSYLRRLFHLAHGMSPKQAFVNTRMQAVDELLNDTALTLETIAERVGFANASTLRRAIKDHFGVNARQLREDRKFARYRFQGKSDLLKCNSLADSG